MTPTCARARARNFARIARAFSLIEILIAVIILGLGLLGLAALFPVVIREQRIGTDNVLGVTVANSAKAVLANTDWSRGTEPDIVGSLTVYRDPWLLMAYSDRQDTSPNDSFSGLSVGMGASQEFELGEWSIPRVLAADQPNIRTGGTIIGEPTVRKNQCAIPLDVRLYPSVGDPALVWDVAVQRISDFDFATPSQFDNLRCAIFVRRIDPRIIVPPGNTLRDVLFGTGTVTNAQRRLPLGEDNNGVPTGDGSSVSSGALRYSSLKTLNYTGPNGQAGTGFNVFPAMTGTAGDPTPITALTNIDITTTEGSLLAQPGQKFVDNLGNICTVTRVESDGAPNRVRVLISPPIPAAARQFAFNGTRGTSATPQPSTRRRLSQIVFAPQVPAGVAIWEVQ